MTSWECYENKWFYTKYKGKMAETESLLSTCCTFERHVFITQQQFWKIRWDEMIFNIRWPTTDRVMYRTRWEIASQQPFYTFTPINSHMIYTSLKLLWFWWRHEIQDDRQRLLDSSNLFCPLLYIKQASNADSFELLVCLGLLLCLYIVASYLDLLWF